MSCTLYARRKPKTEWPWGFKLSLRDKLHEKYGNLITDTAISYLEGLRDASGDHDDKDALDEMISALYSGDEIELKMEC